MSFIQNKQLYYVNSNNRTTGTHSNFTYEFKIPQNEGYDHVCVLDVAIPYSYYVIQTNYNTFTLSEGSSSATVTMPIGNYTAQSALPVLTSALNTASPNHWTYAITYSNVTSKYTFTVSGNNLQPSFTFTTHMSDELGFETNSTNNFVDSKLTSVNVIDMIPEQTLFIRSDMIGQTNNDNVLQEVFVSGTQNMGIIRWVCPDVEAYSKKISTYSTNSFRFILTDENGNQEINLNGQNINFTICIYKKDNVNLIIKEFLKQAYNKI